MTHPDLEEQSEYLLITLFSTLVVAEGHLDSLSSEPHSSTNEFQR